LQKRTKKLLPLRHLGWISARANKPKFLLLFPKRSAPLLPWPPPPKSHFGAQDTRLYCM
jgi:hypothetical protein